MATSAKAQETGFAAASTLMPLVIAPSETGSVVYRQDAGFDLGLNAGLQSASDTDISKSANVSPANGDVFAGAAVSHGVALSATGGTASLAATGGFGVGIAGGIFAASPRVGAGSGQGAFQAEVEQNGAASAQTTGTVGATVDYTNGADVNLASEISLVTRSTTPGPLSEVISSHTETVEPNIVSYTLSAVAGQTDFAANQPGSAAVGLLVGATRAVSVSTEFAAPRTSLSSGFDDTPALSLLAASTEGSITSHIGFDAPRTTVATTGEDAPGVQTLFSAATTSDTAITIGGENFALRTSGDRSHGILASAQGNRSVRNTMSIDGSDAGIMTVGNAAAGLISIANSGTEEAEQHIDLAGRRAAVRTTGRGSVGALMSSLAGGRSINTLALSGAGSAIETSGQAAAGAALFADGVSNAANHVSLAGPDAALQTQSNDASAVISVANSEMNARNALSLTADRTRVGTVGDNASAYLAIATGGEVAETAVHMSGDRSTIGTVGDDSTALMMINSAPDASISTHISGDRTEVSTTGDRSAGVISAALGSLTGSSLLTLSGTDSIIRTSGDFSIGAFLGTSGAASNRQNLSIRGRRAGIETRGRSSAGATLAGQTGELSIVGRDAFVRTTGPDSHGVYFSNAASSATIGKTALVEALGPGSDGFMFKRRDNVAAVTNDGGVSGRRNGIAAEGMLDLINRGSIQGTTGAGVLFDHGHVINEGKIAGAAGIVATQSSDNGITIDTPGAIVSTLGPSGTAISLMGNGDDTLRIGPWTTLTGTIDLGDGRDRLLAGRGVNADLLLRSPIDQVVPETGFASVGDGGTRVIVADPTLYLAHDLAASRLATQLALAHPAHGLPFEALGSVNGCGLQVEARASTSHLSIDNTGNHSAYDLALNGVTGRVGTVDCDRFNASIFGGYFHGEGSVEGPNDNTSHIVLAGLDAEWNIASLVDVSAAAGVGTIDTRSSRRIINNLGRTSRDTATSKHGSDFAFAMLELAGQLPVGNFLAEPYVATDAVANRRGRIREKGAGSAMTIAAGNSAAYTFQAGFRMLNELLYQDRRGRLSMLADLAASARVIDEDKTYAITVDDYDTRYRSRRDRRALGIHAKLRLQAVDASERAKVLVEMNYDRDDTDRASLSFSGGGAVRF